MLESLRISAFAPAAVHGAGDSGSAVGAISKVIVAVAAPAIRRARNLIGNVLEKEANMNDIMHDGTPDGIWNSQDHPSGLPDSGLVSSSGTGAESATARQDARKIRENVARQLAAANDQLMAKNHALAEGAEPRRARN